MAKTIVSSKAGVNKEQIRKARSFSRRALARLATNDVLTRGVKAGGFSLNDLQQDIAAELPDIPLLNQAPEGKESCCYGPWVCDIVAPADDGNWTAIICAANGKLYAVAFTMADGEVTVSADEPKEVEKSTDYEFVQSLIASDAGAPAPAASANRALPKNLLFRYGRAEVGEDGAIQIRLASEYPVRLRARQEHVDLGGASKVGERIYEVLSHSDDDADLSQLHAFLDEHDQAQQLGHVRKAAVSDDKTSRAVLVPDLASDLSKTRAEQIRSGSRPFFSVGYKPVKFLGDDVLGDGTRVKKFAWRAYEASSVAVPADPTARKNRSAAEAEEMHCIHCGEVFEREDLNENYECAPCLEAGRKFTPLKRSGIDSKTVNMADVITQEQLTAAEKTSRAKASTDLLSRNKKIADVVDGWVKDHGMRKQGQCGEALRKIGNEFCLRALDDVPEASMLLELGARCLQEQAKFPADPYLARADMGRKEWAKLSFRSGIESIIKNGRNDSIPTGCREAEVHEAMVKRAKDNGGLGYEGVQVGNGWHLAPDFPVPYVRARHDVPNSRMTRYERDGELLTRDVVAGDFTQGGALVPTQLLVPIIELLYNMEVTDWAGATELAGLSGNIVIPRQTSPSAPQAVAEIGALQASQPNFDQVRGEPHRIGNTVPYSKQLLLQSSPDVEALLHDDNLRMLALLRDEYAINGSGAGSQPLGFMNTPGVNAYALSATPTLAQIIQMETLIRETNIYDPVVFLATSSSRGLLMSSPAQLTGATVVSGQTNALWVSKGPEDEMVIGRPAKDSQQIPATTLLCGAFRRGLLKLLWGGIDVVVDYWTLAATGEIKLTYNAYIDNIVRHPTAFTVGTGMSQ